MPAVFATAREGIVEEMTSRRNLRPTRALARGLAAGALGTAAMTVQQELAQRVQSSGDSDATEHRDPWEEAPAPAQVARLIGERVLGAKPSPDLIPLLTNVMHWSYGIGWGGVFGGLAGAGRVEGGARSGLLFGIGVWLMSYVQLVPLGLYEPPWRYSPNELALDLSYHLAYGTGTGIGFRLLEGDHR